MGGLEPTCLAAHAPEACLYTNFTTSALSCFFISPFPHFPISIFLSSPHTTPPRSRTDPTDGRCARHQFLSPCRWWHKYRWASTRRSRADLLEPTLETLPTARRVPHHSRSRAFFPRARRRSD